MTKISVIVPAYNAAEHIGRMLKSIQDQTFKDYECIVVNDGSTDNTKEIIEAFAAGDARFKALSQKNGGVSVARNLGMSQAVGKYLAFFDADDFVPENSLESMYAAAKAGNADLVIGGRASESLGETKITETSSRISAKKEIDVYNPDLINNFSIWGKLFRRAVAEENNIRFNENLRRAQDGVFNFQFIAKCERIVGSPEIAYIYLKRPYWEEKSITGKLDRRTFNCLREAMTQIAKTVDSDYKRRIEEAADKSKAEIKELECKYESFRSKLFARFVRVSLIDENLGFIWGLDRDIFDEILSLIDEYRKEIFPQDWIDYVTARRNDIPKEGDRYLYRDEIAEKPTVSFAISDKLPAESLNMVLGGIYTQAFPSFEVMVDKRIADAADEGFSTKENYRIIEAGKNFRKTALKQAKAPYIYYIDEPVYLGRNVIRKAYAKISRNDDCVFVTMPISSRADGEFKEVISSETAFINEFSKQKLRTAFNQLDYTWCNKLFRVGALKAKQILFTGDDWKDIDRLYHNSAYFKITDMHVVTDMNDEDILALVRNPIVKLLWKYKYRTEQRFQKKIANREEKIITIPQKLNRLKIQWMRAGYKFMTRKVIFPLVYIVNAFKPIEKNKVVFVETRMAELDPSVTLLWRKLEAEGKYKLKKHFLRIDFSRYREEFKRGIAFIKDSATANYVVMSDACGTYSAIPKRKGTYSLQLWHGCGAFKRFGFSTADLLFGLDRKHKERYPSYRNQDVVTVSSPEVVWAYEEAMALEGKNVIKPIGISRTDMFYDKAYLEAAAERVRELVPETIGKKIILYAPTFRGRTRYAIGPNELDIEEMSEKLGDEYILLIKHHPFVKNPPPIPAGAGGFAFDVSSKANIQDLICVSDICISDYSSLVYEYSLFERPMIFFAYDLEDYCDWRGFYYDYEELTPGPIFNNTDQIIDYIENIDERFDSRAVSEFKEKFMSACDGGATDRIIALMKEHERR